MAPGSVFQAILTTREAAKRLRVCRRTVIKWADDGDIPSWRRWAPAVSAAELSASGYMPAEKPRPDPAVEDWAQTLEQVMTAAADNFSDNGDVRRSRMIRQVPRPARAADSAGLTASAPSRPGGDGGGLDLARASHEGEKLLDVRHREDAVNGIGPLDHHEPTPVPRGSLVGREQCP